MLREVHTYPPNWQEIKQLNPPKEAIFCYGNTVHNPSKGKIPEDILLHESIHAKRQEQYLSPDIWWTKYIHDQDFRKEEELEAYAHQYAFVKRYYSVKAQQDALFEMAQNLSSLYSLGISYPHSEVEIKQRAKNIIY